MKNNEVGGLLFVPRVMHGKPGQLHFCLCKKTPRKRKEQFGCGMQFYCWALQQFFTRGELVAVSHAHPKSNLAVANKHSAKVSYAKQHPQRMVQFFSKCF